MVATVTAEVVTADQILASYTACAYCGKSTSFACLNCQTPMCCMCRPADFCGDCTMVALQGYGADWDNERQPYNADTATVACAGCGTRIAVDDPSEDVFCMACEIGGDALAA